MRKLCPAVLIIVLLTATSCTATHRRTAARSADTTTSQHASSAAESTPPPGTRTVVTSTPAVPVVSPTSRAASISTARITIRPVTSTGDPVPGYSVTTEDLPSFSCSSAASPVAVSPNIRFCGYSATNTVACWKSSAPSTVLCLRDPLTRSLIRIKYTGAFGPTPATTHPVPQALTLDDDDHCQIRDGGAWDYVPTQPTWVGWYYCANGNDIYGPAAGNGIDQTRPTWTVHKVAQFGSGTITTHAVTTAYFVGTA
jgi:hypothetical protein